MLFFEESSFAKGLLRFLRAKGLSLRLRSVCLLFESSSDLLHGVKREIRKVTSAVLSQAHYSLQTSNTYCSSLPQYLHRNIF